jgi:hypothetical protein
VTKAVSWLLAVQLRFIAWQFRVFGRFFPNADVSIDIIPDLVQFPQKDFPLEVRIAISKLIVARRRGI